MRTKILTRKYCTKGYRYLLVLLVVAGCGGNADTNKSSKPVDEKKSTKTKAATVDSRVINLFKNEAAVEVLNSFEKVQAYRMPPMSFQQDQVDQYKILAGPTKVEDSVAKQLASLLVDANSYEWERSKGCEPDYGVRLEFSKADKKIDVLFCFGCDFLLIYENGQVGNGEDFDKIRKALLGPMKTIFKDDAVIQGLK